MKVLVTGANGYIGRHVVKNLLDNGLDVIACDINVENMDSRVKKIAMLNLVRQMCAYIWPGEMVLCIMLLPRWAICLGTIVFSRL